MRTPRACEACLSIGPAHFHDRSTSPERNIHQIFRRACSVTKQETRKMHSQIKQNEDYCSNRNRWENMLHSKRNEQFISTGTFLNITATTFLGSLVSHQPPYAVLRNFKRPLPLIQRINPLRTKLNLFYIRTQLVPRSNHFPSRL
jgi:hypothetical protein